MPGCLCQCFYCFLVQIEYMMRVSVGEDTALIVAVLTNTVDRTARTLEFEESNKN